MAEGGWNLAATPQNDLHSSLAPSPPLILAGPTAVGKSEVALRLAETLNGEIVCVDSMQVYRGMDIGTAKQSAAERAYVRHHLVDVVEVTEPFDAAQFVRLASPAVSAIQGRNRVPILCGGTGLYFKAFFEGLGEAPPGWWQSRRHCWPADWHKTNRRASRWAIGRWRNTCAANGRCRRRSSWSKSAPASSPNGK